METRGGRSKQNTLPLKCYKRLIFTCLYKEQRDVGWACTWINPFYNSFHFPIFMVLDYMYKAVMPIYIYLNCLIWPSFRRNWGSWHICSPYGWPSKAYSNFIIFNLVYWLLFLSGIFFASCSLATSLSSTGQSQIYGQTFCVCYCYQNWKRILPWQIG